MSALVSVPHQLILSCLAGSEWPLQWGDPRWPDGSQLFLSRWIFHMLLCVPQLWVRRWEMHPHPDRRQCCPGLQPQNVKFLWHPDTTYYQLVLPGRICFKFNSYVNWTAAVAMSQLDVWSLPILFVCMATNLFCPHLFPGAHRAGINECLKKSPENSYDDFSCHFYYLNSIKNPKAQIIMGLCCVQWLGLIWFT